MAQGLLKWFTVTGGRQTSVDAGSSDSRHQLPSQSSSDDDTQHMQSEDSGLSLNSDSTEDLSIAVSSTKKQQQHLIPSEPNQPKHNFSKSMFGNQKRAFSATWYQHHPWLHYLQEEDSVLCFYCATAVQRKMPLTDKTFTETGFNNWQKVLKTFW